MAPPEGKNFNTKHSAVKRILKEVEEMRKDSSKEYYSMPIEEDLFEWQFAVHGPPDSEFEGGIYHGRIILPPEYPFKPPSFMLLTPSGRFEVQTKICLNISHHHPEQWQPSWSVRTALVALIAFFTSKGDGAIGSLDYPPEERKKLAIKSRTCPPKFGSPERQKVINMIHERMLSVASTATDPKVKSESNVDFKKILGAVENSSGNNINDSPKSGSFDPSTSEISPNNKEKQFIADSINETLITQESNSPSLQYPVASNGGTRDVNGIVETDSSSNYQLRKRVPAGKQDPSPLQNHAKSPAESSNQLDNTASRSTSAPATPPHSLEDRLLNWLAVLLFLAIVGLLAKKVVKLVS